MMSTHLAPLSYRGRFAARRPGARSGVTALVALCTLAIGLVVAPSVAGAAPATPTPVQVTGDYPVSGVATGGGYTFLRVIGCGFDDEIQQYDQSGNLVQTYDLGTSACYPQYSAVASDGTYVATLSPDGVLFIIDIATQQVETADLSAYLPFPDDSYVTVASGSVYATDVSDGSVVAVSISSGDISWVSNAVDGNGPMVVNGSDLAVFGESGVSTLALANGVPDGAYDFGSYGGEPFAATVLGGKAFVTYPGGAGLVEFSLADYSVLNAQFGGQGVLGISSDGSNLWMSDQGQDAVLELDPSTLDVLNSVDLDYPFYVAIDGYNLWVDSQWAPLWEVQFPPHALQYPSTTSLSVPSGASPTVGASTTVTATVSVPGTVEFFDNGEPVSGCTFVAATSTATCAWTPTTAGPHSLTAELTPSDSTYAISTSSPLALSVALPAATVSVATSSGASTVVAGRGVTLSATVSTPGTVTFYAGATLIAGCVGVPAAATTATCAWTPTSAGPVTVKAVLAPYSPSFQGATATDAVTVAPPSLTLVVSGFSTGVTSLSARQRAAVTRFVATVVADGYGTLSVAGFGDGGASGLATGRARASSVGAIVQADLAAGSGSLSVHLSAGGRGGRRVVLRATA